MKIKLITHTMVDIDFEKAIKYPFEDKRWMVKLGIYLALYAVIYYITQGVNFGTSFLTNTSKEISSNSTYNTYILTMIRSFAVLGVEVLLFPISLYLGGYGLKTIRNIMNKEESPLPEHGEYVDTILLDLKVFVIEIALCLISLIVGGILCAPLIAGLILMVNNSTLGIILVVIGGVLALIAIALSLALSIFVEPAMTYRLLKTNTLGEAFTSYALEIARKYWGNFLLYAGISIVIAIVLMVIAFVTCCISFIVAPLLTVYEVFVLAYIRGVIFRDIAEQEGK